jgi:hypothetical protein
VSFFIISGSEIPLIFKFNKMKNLYIKLLLAVLIVISCSKDSDDMFDQSSSQIYQQTAGSNSSNTTSTNSSSQTTSTNSSSQSETFDRGTILLNYSENIIIPRYNTFKLSMDNLKNSIETFKSSPTSESYDLLQNDWIDAYKKWQYIEMFNISKAEEIMYNLKMNTYPVSKERIDNNIDTEKTDLSNPNDWSAQGFPGLDYMMHGIAENKDAVIELYSTNSKYGNYLSTLGNLMSDVTNSVVEDWSSYKDIFNTSIENTATSAFNMMVNDFVFYFEKGLRTNKIGIPAGRFSSLPLPEKIEAYYYSKNGFGNLSKTLVLEARQAATDFFTGSNSEGVRGPSYSTYLDYLETEIGPTVETKLEEAKVRLDILQDNFINQIDDNNTLMLQAFDALQTIVVNLKTDMLSNFNIAVDYTDADGD